MTLTGALIGQGNAQLACAMCYTHGEAKEKQTESEDERCLLRLQTCDHSLNITSILKPKHTLYSDKDFIVRALLRKLCFRTRMEGNIVCRGILY